MKLKMMTFLPRLPLQHKRCSLTRDLVIQVNRVATFRELDNDLLKQAAFLTLDNDMDLKLLTLSLSPEADLIEEDKQWDWDKLFTEVTSELATQWEKEQGEETEQPDKA